MLSKKQIIESGYPDALKMVHDIITLRGALRQMVYETTHLSPMEDDGSHKCRISAAALADARSALPSPALESGLSTG